jgi:hypothetical protein
LAYLPCESQFYSQNKYIRFLTETKQFGLFQRFAAVLSSFVSAQQQPGTMYDVYLPLADKGKDVNMFIVPLAFIVGDNQGGDGIVIGHVSIYNETACINFVRVAMPRLHNMI